MHEQFDSGAAGVGEEVALVGLGSTEYLHHARKQPVGTGAHVDGIDSQPDADAAWCSRLHRNSSKQMAERCGSPLTCPVSPRH